MRSGKIKEEVREGLVGGRGGGGGVHLLIFGYLVVWVLMPNQVSNKERTVSDSVWFAKWELAKWELAKWD